MERITLSVWLIARTLDVKCTQCNWEGHTRKARSQDGKLYCPEELCDNRKPLAQCRNPLNVRLGPLCAEKKPTGRKTVRNYLCTGRIYHAQRNLQNVPVHLFAPLGAYCVNLGGSRNQCSSVCSSRTSSTFRMSRIILPHQFNDSNAKSEI
mgnify:CR=1 FL=1